MLSATKPTLVAPQLRFALSEQARLRYAQYLLWQAFAMLGLLWLFVSHSCQLFGNGNQHVWFASVLAWLPSAHQTMAAELVVHALLLGTLLFLTKQIASNTNRCFSPASLVVADGKLFWQNSHNNTPFDVVHLNTLDTIDLHGSDIEDLLQDAPNNVSLHLKRRFHQTIILKQQDFEQSGALLQLLPRLMSTTHPKIKIEFHRDA